ncbi:MAG: hypothetical protein ACI9JN_002475 [Bacteroidia bacterium]
MPTLLGVEMLRKDFTVVFGALKEGFHDFKYQLNDDFFALIEQDLIHKGEISVLLNLERSERYMTCDFTLTGWAMKTCDVCLSDLKYPVKSVQSLHIKITDKAIEDEPDLISLASNAYELDLTNHLFDYIVLSLPMKLECKDSLNRKACDDKVLEMLSNSEGETDNSNHPEWQKLKEIFKN